MEETGVTAVRPKNKETGDNEHRLPHKELCCKTIIYATTLEGGRRLTSVKTDNSKQNHFHALAITVEKKSSYIIRRILPVLNPVLGSPPVAQAYFECNVAVYKNGKKAIDT